MVNGSEVQKIIILQNMDQDQHSLNYIIKMFGQEYEFLESMTLQDYPCFACSLSDTEVAVTIPV
ncbi:hypothetical protein ACJMK2_004195 [Sinanodonta woodiana]|uniref:Uncharacterized protein n=1 Tax=Sinanodonta woodiana TaxID=1069815 RepID=A0ABD3Y339_SINWO